MFDRLKKKLRSVKERIAAKISSKPAEPVPEPTEGVEPEVIEVEPKPPSEVPEARAPPLEAPPVLPPEKPKKAARRVVKRLLRRKLSPEDVDDIIWDLQVALLESDVAVPVADHIIERLKTGLTGRKIGVREDPRKLAEELLRQSIREVLTTEQRVDLVGVIDSKRARGEPAVIVFLGINGHGKTTTIAKLARYLTGRGYRVVLAAADTFRAAGIEQLEIHGQRLGLEVVKQRRGADAAAVAFDAIAHARAGRADVVLVDTAGRIQTDVNLMDEMRKIVRVAKPDLVIFVGDALTGNDAVEQAKTFDQAVGITGSILCKMDADARGGAALSITHVTGKPILFLGTGQGYDDLVEFDPDFIINALFGD
jgi:fused signal recognition particle receptor